MRNAWYSSMRWEPIARWLLCMPTRLWAAEPSSRSLGTLRQEHHAAYQPSRWRDGTIYGRGGGYHRPSVRDIYRALAGSRLKARSDRGYGQPGSAQAKEDKGAHRGARMRAFVSALILTRSEPHRGSPLEDKAYPPEDDERPHQGCADRGDGLGAGSREVPGCTRVLCLLRLPNPGAAVMKGAVKAPAEMVDGSCRLNSIQS